MPGLIQQEAQLLKERAALKDLRMPYLYGKAYDPQRGWHPPTMPQDMNALFAANDQALQLLRGQMYATLRKLLDRLPRCDECDEIATHQLRNGPYFCAFHAEGRSTAQRVDWYEELRVLYSNDGAGSDLATPRPPPP